MTKYLPGQSGNPAGKKKGTINKRTRLAQLLEPYAEELVAKMVELARAGDMNALRLCIERLIPKATNEDISIKLPDITNINGNLLLAFSKEILSALSGQEINIDQTKALIGVLKLTKKITPYSQMIET